MGTIDWDTNADWSNYQSKDSAVEISGGSIVFNALQTVGRYQFEAGGGGTAQDTSPNNNDGTVTGASWSTDSQQGTYSLSFDGTDDDVIVSSPTEQDGLNPATITFWIKPDTRSGFIFCVLAGSNATGDSYIGWDSNRIEFYLDTDPRIYSSTTLSTGTWYHVALAWDATDLICYIDGSQDNTASSSSSWTWAGAGQDLCMASRNSNSSWWGGHLDDVRFYDVMLTSSQINDIYSGNL